MPTQPRNTLLLATDRQKSVMNAVDVSGVDDIRYTVYGHSQLDASQSRLRFNGELQELMTGYYPLGQGYRMYSSRLMRFIIPDSPFFSPFGEGGLNPYAYCGGDPINRVDPSGHAFGFLKAIGRNLGLRTSAKAKAAKTFSARHKSVAPSKLFTDESLIKSAKLGETRFTPELNYQKKSNSLHLTRDVNNKKFSFTSEVKINSKSKPLSQETLTSITPNSNLEVLDPDTFSYVNKIKQALDNRGLLGPKDIDDILHPKVKRNQIRLEKRLDDYYNAPRAEGDPNRFLYRSGGGG